MRATKQGGVAHGVIAGLLAGAIVALWFLVVDLTAGDPLRTPATLGAELFERPEAAGRTAVVGLYSLLHFGVFAILGAATATFLGATGLAPGWFLGLFFGLGVLNGVHYVGLLVTDDRFLMVLPWVHVVGANLLAGLALMSYLHRALGEDRPLGLGTLRYHPLVSEGLGVGLFGAGAVALWFLLVDIASGEPLRTPAALGSLLFLGAESPVEVERSAAMVAAFTIVHLVAFGLAGVALVAIARQVERLPALAYAVALAAILLEAVTIGVLTTFGGWVMGTLSVWAIGIANLLAIGAMAGWIWRTHPRLRERVAEEGFASTA